jgi:hypothetical protein
MPPLCWWRRLPLCSMHQLCWLGHVISPRTETGPHWCMRFQLPSSVAFCSDAMTWHATKGAATSAGGALFVVACGVCWPLVPAGLWLVGSTQSSIACLAALMPVAIQYTCVCRSTVHAWRASVVAGVRVAGRPAARCEGSETVLLKRREVLATETCSWFAPNFPAQLLPHHSNGAADTNSK